MADWRPSLESRPIQFDLLTLFVATTVWALLLTAMRLLHLPVAGYILISVLLVVVGIALVLFRNWGRPVLIAICCGIIVTVFGELFFRVIQGIPLRGFRLPIVAFGAAYGIFAFFFFDAVFILSERIRAMLKRRSEEGRTDIRSEL